MQASKIIYPAGGSVQPMRGESINAFLAGTEDAVHDENYLTVLSHKGRVLVRQGKWKLSNLEPPFDEDELGLFDLDADPGETHNLGDSEPEKYRELLELWRTERRNLGIVLPQDL
jgi:arylsulfatase